MQKNRNDFSRQEAQRLASSEAGQQLLAMLQKKHGSSVSSALSSVQAGDLEQARIALSQILSDPEAKKLLRQLQENCHG